MAKIFEDKFLPEKWPSEGKNFKIYVNAFSSVSEL